MGATEVDLTKKENPETLNGFRIFSVTGYNFLINDRFGGQTGLKTLTNYR